MAWLAAGEKISEWNAKMRNGIKDVRELLKAKKGGAPAVVEDCKTRGKAYETTEEHWGNVWNTKATDWTQIGNMMKHVPRSERGKWRKPN